MALNASAAPPGGPIRARIARAGVAIAALALAVAPLATPSPAGTIRASYVYDYMPPDHLDSLAARGFDRALVHWIPDSLDAAGAARQRALVARGLATGVEFVPEWLLQQPKRLASRPAARRYTWGRGTVEATVACPLDSVYWRSALIDRIDETLAVSPEVRRVAVDLELLNAGRHHYDAGPCRCRACVAEYAHGRAELMARDPATLSGLLPWEETRLARLLGALLAECAARHPGVEIGVLDLDLDSFVHRALGRALARRGLPTTDYTERSYSTGAASLPAARARLDALGLRATPLVGGVWLKRFTPTALADSVRAITARADGYFVFTTFSLWQTPSRLSGPYTLQGEPAAYWDALRNANRTP